MVWLLIWIASFLAMAIFWRFMGFSWFLWNVKDFAQVQNGHCKRLRNGISSLEICLKDMEASSKVEVLNKNQCVHLFGKLLLAMKGIHSMMSIATQDLKFQFVYEELCRLQKKVEILGSSCIEQDRWCHYAAFQLQNKEAFRELLLDLKCCYDTSCNLYLLHHSDQSNHVLPIQFDAVFYEEVLEDRRILKRRLEGVLQSWEDYKIAQHLLLRLRNLDRVDGGDLDALEVPNDFKVPELIKEIGKGSYGHVHHSNWLGLPCATKVMQGNSEFFNIWQKEVGILAGLSHPNLVQFFGCGIIHKMNEPNVEEIGGGKPSEMQLVMELMETNLSSILKKAKRPLPYHLAIDIMHQIAKGVYFLHDMQVAHLDLKPDNVLSSSISMEGLDPYHTFKITDYGECQLEVCSHPKDPKPSNYTFRTRRYRSPEASKGSRSPFYPFQADVWSFGMIYAEILSRKAPSSSRPDLPNNCKGLTDLIEECCVDDPLHRPTFSKICDRLVSVKKSFWNGTYPWNMVPQFGSSSVARDSKSNVRQVPKVGSLGESVIDLEHQLSKAKELLNLHYVGIVGMDGIGKTTLAIALFHDVVEKSLYQASHFVSKCKDRSPYEILCEILQNLHHDGKPSDLRDAQVMMKEVLISKKVLLILNDVDDGDQVHNIVPPHIVQASKSTTIVITTRNWSTIKSFVCNEGRFDVALLHDEAAASLFMTHLSWDVASLSPDFVNLRKHVVEACRGLPLSLKVMGAFLRTKEKLRSWERALQRMSRGKTLDGDGELWKTLMISYDGLSNDVEKGMFLDMACFFCKDVYPFGVTKETMLSIWSDSGIFLVQALERLIDMSLLKVNEDEGILEMHDQLRDMGIMLAEGTRIWKASMLPELGFTTKDCGIVQGLSLLSTEKRLQTLVKYIESIDFENLRVMILMGSFDENFELMAPESHEELTILNFLLLISSHAPHLKAILINTLEALLALPQEVRNLPSLTTLNLWECSSLVALPKEVGNLSSLTTLDLYECSSLVALPEEVGNMSSLTTLDLYGCSSLVALPQEVGNFSSLTTLNLYGCSRLVSLPEEVGNLSSLTTLNLKECSSLVALPQEVGNLSSLTTLNLKECSSLVALTEEVGNLSSLTTLNLEGCSSLVALPEEVGNLSSLTSLYLRGCSSLVALREEVENLSSLTTLNLWNAQVWWPCRRK